MNVKQTAKKITAVVTGAALFTGFTVAGAAALDLSDYPEPFVVDGAFNGKIVVGSDAHPSDIVGAIDLSASLQREATTPVTGTTGVSLEGGYEFEGERLNVAFPGSNFPVLDDRDLAGFLDVDVDWDDDTVRVTEALWFDEDALEAVTSIGNQKFEEYGTNAFLNVERGSIHYRLLFEDNVQADKVNATDEGKLILPIMGHEIEVTRIDDTEMRIETASLSGVLNEGESWEVEGKTIEIVRIHENGVLLEIDGVRRNLGSTASNERIEGLRMTVEDHVWIDTADDFNFVELKAGEEITETVRKGDAMTSFGQDEDDPEWVWHWELRDVGSDDHIDWIGAALDIGRFLTEDEVEYADERPALAYGESLHLPNDYAAVTFDGYYDTGSNEISMNFRSLRLDYENGTRSASEDFLVISSDSTRAPFRFDGVRADTIYIASVNETHFELGYQDGDDRVWHNDRDPYNGTISVELVRLQDDVTISGAADDYLVFTFGSETLGFSIEDYDEFTDDYLNYTHGGTTINLGEEEYGVKLAYGVSFTDPESMIDDDRFRMHVPHEPAEPRVTVSGPDTARTVTTTDGAYVVNPLGTGIAILDSQASLGSEPYLVVGGPFANTVARQLLGNPSDEEVRDMFQPNTAMIRLYAGQNAILVAGHDAQDTVRASYVLANFRDYDLTGTGVDLVTSDATNIQVTPVN